MRKNINAIFSFMHRLGFIFVFIIISLSSGYSQIDKIIKDFVSPKTGTEEHIDSVKNQDSLTIAELNEKILQLSQNESLIQERLLAYEQLKVADSLSRIQRKELIDSLRNVTQGMPVIVEGDTLFSIYPIRGISSVATRAGNTAQMVRSLGADPRVKPDSINLLSLEGYTEITYDDRAIIILSDDDAIWMNMPLDSIAKIYREKIVDKVKYLQVENSRKDITKRSLEFAGVIIALGFLFYGLNYLFKKLKIIVKKRIESRFKGGALRIFRFLNLKQALQITFFAINVLRYILMLLALVVAIPILFFIFPQTRDIANTLFGYILTPVKSIFFSIVAYIPNLFTIIIIWLIIHYILKGLKYISNEIGAGKLKISGFYPDWASPTFNLVRFFLYAFMLALIYRYLPGADNGVFQGISVFIGIIVSLGSTAVIGNIVAGFVIIYMRPFKIGDMIKLNDTIGRVVEKTAFVTRICTLKNEIITIPNSVVLSSHTTNYTASADNYGLIIHTSIGVGYDVPNKRVHELLIKAALMTKGVLSDRDPFVLDKKFEDLYQLYEINAYIKDANAISRISSDLHHTIQNVFIEAGIKLQVPFVVSQTETTHDSK